MRFAIFLLLSGFILPASPAEEDDWGSPASGPSASLPALSMPSAISAGTARQIQLLKVRANGLYRARKYRDALALYAAWARLDPGDPDARNDLADGYLKLGRQDSALACAREALRLADRSLAAADTDTASWSFPDLRARKNAYFLLDKLGARMSPPKPGRCEIWTASDGECRARMHVCAERGSRTGPEGTLRWDILRAGVSGLRALFAYDEVEVPSQVPRPELRDMEAASIGGASESESRWVNRDSSATLPLGEFLETADPACSGPACGNLERERVGCRILYFDPCAGVIGMACAYSEADGPDRLIIGEAYLIPRH
jgi:tetratricopeptide (TPR) repeat protein